MVAVAVQQLTTRHVSKGLQDSHAHIAARRRPGVTEGGRHDRVAVGVPRRRHSGGVAVGGMRGQVLAEDTQVRVADDVEGREAAEAGGD